MLPCFFSTSDNLNPFRTPPYSRFALSAILFCTLRWQALYGRPNGIKIFFFLHSGDNDYGGGCGSSMSQTRWEACSHLSLNSDSLVT
jgi:hypothetical protein